MIRVVVAVLGGTLTCVAWLSVLRTVFTPRERPALAARWVTGSVSAVVLAVARRLPSAPRERLLDLCAPLSLFVMACCWLVSSLLGFVSLAWAFSDVGLDSRALADFFLMRSQGVPLAALAWLSTALMLVAFMTHLVRFTGAYSRRERLVARLAAQAERPLDAETVLAAYVRSGPREHLDAMFAEWAGWMADVRCTHVGYPALTFARPAGELCWLNAATIVLDTAALTEAVAPSWAPPHTRVLLNAGTQCMQRLASQLGLAPPSATIVSLHGREERGFDESRRLAISAGLLPEGSEAQARIAFQRQRRRYGPQGSAIAAHLLFHIPVRPEGRLRELRADRAVHGPP